MPYIQWAMKDLANSIKKMQRNKFDAVVVFDGKRGLGKSTGGVKLSLNFDNFKMRKDIVFSREDVMNSLASKKYGIILADEMINVTYNRDFYSNEQKKLLKMLNMYRDSCNVLIACVPNFYDLDKQFRALVKLRINVIRRGLAIIHSQNKSSYSSDPWDLSVNEKIEKSWLKKGISKPNYSRLTTFRGVLRYGDLGKKQRELYEKIKQKKRGKLVEVEEDLSTPKNTTIYEKLITMLLNSELSKDALEKICEINNIKYSTMSMALNKRLSDAKTGHTLTHYFIDSSPKSNNSLKVNDSKVYKLPPLTPNMN